VGTLASIEVVRIRVPGGWLKERICAEEDGLPWDDVDLINEDGSRGMSWVDFFCGV
jgi:hypothetical protein